MNKFIRKLFELIDDGFNPSLPTWRIVLSLIIVLVLSVMTGAITLTAIFAIPVLSILFLPAGFAALFAILWLLLVMALLIKYDF